MAAVVVVPKEAPREGEPPEHPLPLPSPFDAAAAAQFVLMTIDADQRDPAAHTQPWWAWWSHADLRTDRMHSLAMDHPCCGIIEPYGSKEFMPSSIGVDSAAWHTWPSSAPSRPGVLWAVSRRRATPAAKRWTPDTVDARLKHLSTALTAFGDVVRRGTVACTTLAVPLFTGCEYETDVEVRDGAWHGIKTALRSFARHYGIALRFVAPLAQCTAEAPYAHRPAPTPDKDLAAWVSTLQRRGSRTHAWDVPLAGPRSKYKRVDPRELRLKRFVAPWRAVEAARQPAPRVPESTRMALSVFMGGAFGGGAGGAGAATGFKRGRPMAKVKYPPPPGTKWTTETWLAANVTAKFTREYIEWGRGLEQGTKAWLECEGKENTITTSRFGKLKRAVDTGNMKMLREVVRSLVHKRGIPANHFMKWGNLSEDRGKAVFAAAAACGLLDRLPFTHHSRSPSPFETLTNAQSAACAAAVAGGTSEYIVEEVMESRGVNIDVEDKVLAYSYDGLYRMWRRDVPGPRPEPEYVLLEVKCPAKPLVSPRLPHVGQMVGMMGGLRKQGYPITRCVYVTWHRHMARFWQLRHDEGYYQELRGTILKVYHSWVLPLFVARDNGELGEDEVDIAGEMPDITTLQADAAIASALASDVDSDATAGVPAPPSPPRATSRKGKPVKRRRRRKLQAVGAHESKDLEQGQDVAGDVAMRATTTTTATTMPKAAEVAIDHEADQAMSVCVDVHDAVAQAMYDSDAETVVASE